jgi:hypothetical protein
MFIVLMDGSKTESHGTATTNRLLYQPQMINECGTMVE